ncbi:MAG: regulatory protein RecX [Candidatus Omnitrophica bacterium]|nr:regulatory protein RecX [Candidatus Omnitrophota bacterium]
MSLRAKRSNLKIGIASCLPAGRRRPSAPRNDKAFKDAREYAFLLLKFRSRSAQELRQRLEKKKFTPQAVEETIGFLKEKKFIDDLSFARAWVTERLKKPFGLRRIELELRQKGISAPVIEESLKAAQDGYIEEEIVRGVAKERFSRLEGIEPQKARRRLYGYLVRRGFSPEIIVGVLENLR